MGMILDKDGRLKILARNQESIAQRIVPTLQILGFVSRGPARSLDAVGMVVQGELFESPLGVKLFVGCGARDSGKGAIPTRPWWQFWKGAQSRAGIGCHAGAEILQIDFAHADEAAIVAVDMAEGIAERMVTRPILLLIDMHGCPLGSTLQNRLLEFAIMTRGHLGAAAAIVPATSLAGGILETVFQVASCKFRVFRARDTAAARAWLVG